MAWPRGNSICARAARELRRAGEHAVRRSGNDSREAAGHACRKHGVERAADGIDRCIRIVEVNAREAVDLKIDEARGEINGSVRIRLSGRTEWSA